MEAQARSKLTTGENNRIRSEGYIPAVVYGGGEKPLHISVPNQDIKRGGKYFYTTPIELQTEKGVIKVLPKEVAMHPVTSALLHIDFIRIVPGGKVKVKVPLEVLNASISKGVRMGGVVTLLRKKILALCAVDKIPLSIEVDVEKLSIGENFRISQLQVPDGCSLFGVPHQPVISVTGASKQEEEEEATSEKDTEESEQEEEQKSEETAK